MIGRCRAEATVSRRAAYEVREGRYQRSGRAKRNRLRRMHSPRQMVVSSSQMRRMRSHRLLRQFTKSACIETLRRDGAPGNHELRAGRALVLRLPYRRILRRPKASGSTLASAGPTGTRTDRSGPLKLANAASRIGRARRDLPRHSTASHPSGAA